MEQEQSKPERGPVDQIAVDKLDSLSGPLAERVMRRAIELQSDDDYGSEKITMSRLERIAAEIGVSAIHLQSALKEELSPALSTTSGWLDKILIPERLTAGLVVHQSRPEVERQVVDWLRSEEGFVPTRVSADGYEWKRDDRVSAKLRAGLSKGGSESGLRSVRWVTHRQTDLADGSQLVELDLDARVVRYTALGVGGGLIALGLAGSILSAINSLGSSAISSFLTPLIPSTFLGIGVGLLIAKTWGKALRDSTIEALHGISSPELAKYRRGSGRQRIARAVDSVEASLDSLFRDL
jgi:hypothetical protein